MNNNNKLGFLPGYVSWLTIVLFILAIFTFFAISNTRVQYAMRMVVGSGMVEYPDIKAMPIYDDAVTMMDNGVTNSAGEMTTSRDDYPYPNPGVPVTDTREFLKTHYNASMRTRDVPALTQRVETTVRGHDGRIDRSESSAEKYGYVSFALPQVKYDAFRTELEGLVGSRFIKVNISSQNLLSQKVSIEEQQERADTTLANYKTARQKIVSAHASAVLLIQAKIDATTATSSERVSLEQQLVRENASYTKNLNNADANIKYAQNWQKAVQTQDATLLANVATVNGTVSIQWISFWEIAQLYLPGYWIPAILALLAVASFTRDRRRSVLIP